MIQTLPNVRSKKDVTEKDDKLIKWTYNDVQNEWALVRTSDLCREKWERFFKKHVNGELTCPELGHLIKDTPNFKTNHKVVAPLSKNWLRCLELLTEKEISKMASYLLNKETVVGRSPLVYPKVVPFGVKASVTREEPKHTLGRGVEKSQ